MEISNGQYFMNIIYISLYGVIVLSLIIDTFNLGWFNLWISWFFPQSTHNLHTSLQCIVSMYLYESLCLDSFFLKQWIKLYFWVFLGSDNRLSTSFTSTNVKLRLRFDVHLTFPWHSPEPHLTTWPSSDLPLTLTRPLPNLD